MTDERASGSNRHFEHTESTTGTRADIWRLWTDVESWKRWDQGLADATIDQAFAKGAEGTIIPNSGPKTKFTITDMDPGTSYTFVTKLPGAQLRIRRDLVDGPHTTFRHTVWFDGPLAAVFATILGRGFRRQLPGSMRLLANEATQNP